MGVFFSPTVAGMSAGKVQALFIPLGSEFFYLPGRAIGSAVKQIPLRGLCLHPARLLPNANPSQAQPASLQHLLAFHSGSIYKEPQSPWSSYGAGPGDLEDGTSLQAHVGSRRSGISSGSCSPVPRAAASFTAC